MKRDRGVGKVAFGRLQAALLATTALVALVGASPAAAQNATWSSSGNSDYNTAANWSPAAVPTGIATFGNSSQTFVTNVLGTVDQWLFTVGASNYTFVVDSFSFTGAGIQINGGSASLNVIASSLNFNNSSTAGSAIITNSGGMAFNGLSTAGSASILNNGTTFDFNNSSTAGNAFITNTSNLNFNNASTAGSATITNNASGTVSFGNTSTAGSANITNNSVLLFNDSSTLGSATITNTSGVEFNNTSSTGTGTVINNGFFAFKDSSTAGSATFTNNSRLFFQASSSAGSASITNTDELQFFNTASAGNATILNNGSSFSFNNTSTAGSATITNNNTVTFSDSSTAGNAAITNNGSLNFNNSSTAENATITTTSGATTLFANSASGGSARMIIQSGGAVDIGNVFGGTTFGSIEGAGVLRLEGNNGVVGSNNLSTTFSGVIDGNGSALTKTGTGMLTLDGINTYNGATTVNAGTLAVNGSTVTSSLTTVNAGGTLGGSGIVGNTTISGGTLAPGNSIGTLTIQGNLVFTAAASYMVEVSPTAADRTNVTGTATLGGATVKASFAAGSYVAKQYTIINAAGGVTGTFSSLVNTNLPSSVTSSLSYDASNVYLDLKLAFAIPGGLNGNQAAVGNALTNSFNANGGIPLTFTALSADGLTQAAGPNAAATQTATFDAMGQFVGMIIDPNNAGRGAGAAGGATGYAPDDAMAYANAPRKAEKAPFARVFTKAAPADPFASRWSIWAAGFGGSQTTDGVASAGSNTTTSSIYGAAAGADYRFSPNTIAGFALAGGGTNFRTANLGSGRSDLFQAGAFVRHNIGNAYITAAAAYGWQDVTTDRTLTIAGVDRLRANFNTNTLIGRVEGGYRFVSPFAGGIGLTPYAAGQVTTVFLPGYAEQTIAGANTFALAYTSRDVTATRSELGLRADKSYVMQTAILTLRGRAAWAHNFDPDRSINATFQSLPGASFTVNGAAASRNTALTTASAEWRWFNNWSVSGTFEGEFSDRTRSYAGKGLVRYVW